MQKVLFRSAARMEEAVLRASAEGALILTPTGRLADRYRHAERMGHIRAQGKSGSAWCPSQIIELRAWVRSRFGLLWDPRLLPGSLLQLRLWHDAAERAESAGKAPAPEGLALTPPLFHRLQEAYDTHRQQGLGREEAGDGALADWRSEVFRQFERLLKSNGLLAWHQVVETVASSFLHGPAHLPRRVILPLDTDPPPLTMSLLLALAEHSPTETWHLAPPATSPLECRVVHTAEQECRMAVAEAARAWETSRGEASLGIVALDESLAPLLAAQLDEISGRRRPEEGWSLYGALVDAPLASHPLCIAALFPLAPPESDSAETLCSWLRCAFAHPKRFQGLESEVLRPLLQRDFAPSWEETVHFAARRFPALEPLERLCRSGTRPLAHWIEALFDTWDALGFFRFGGRGEIRDACASAEGILRSALGELSAHCGHIPADRDAASGWIGAALEGLGAEQRSDRGGLQLLKSGDLFGLPFDQIWAVGAHGGALPPPVAPHPLLSPRERAALENGDPASHSWGEGLRILGETLASVQEPSAARISRALLGGDGERPTLPCPYLPERYGDSERRTPLRVDLWGGDRGDWLEVPWMAGASAGLEFPVSPAAPPSDATLFPLPEDLRVTALDDILQCPFRYFAKGHLGLDRPEEPKGLSAISHGRLIHRVANAFARVLNSGASPDGWPNDIRGAWAILRALAGEAISEMGDSPALNAERLLLLGDDDQGTKSLLRPWLEAERKRAQEGWRILPPASGGEHPFEGLRLDSAGILIHGKADRVDRRLETFAVWDYKSGEPPRAAQVLQDLNYGQLPAYVLALRGGFLTSESSPPKEHTGPVLAGYIAMRPRSKGSRPFHLPVGPKDESWEAFLSRWQERLAERARPARSGIYPADPVIPPAFPGESGTACANCLFHCLCGYFEMPGESGGREEEGEE